MADDNSVNRMLAKRLLEKIGCRVDTANDGNEAIALLRNTSYDMVFMDCHMPQMDGFEATRIMRKDQAGPRRIPIVALTASVTARDREECLVAGMDDFVASRLQGTIAHLRGKGRATCGLFSSSSSQSGDPPAIGGLWRRNLVSLSVGDIPPLGFRRIRQRCAPTALVRDEPLLAERVQSLRDAGPPDGEHE